MAWPIVAVAALVAGAVFILVSVTLFLLGPGNRGNRVYALATFLYGLDMVTNAFLLGLEANSWGANYARRLNVYPFLASPVVVLYFFLTYPERPAWLPTWAARPFLYIAVLAGLLLAWILLGRPIGEDGGLGGGTWLDNAIAYTEDPILAAGALLFFVRARQARNHVAARSLSLIGLGLAGYSAVNGSEGLLKATYDRVPFWAPLGAFDDAIQLFLLVPTMYLLWKQRQERPFLHPHRGIAFVLVALALGVTSSPFVAGDAAPNVYAIVFFAFVLLNPAMVVYAIIRHQFFDLDLRFRRTVSRSFVIAFFVGAFVIASQLAEGFAQATLGGRGWVVGAVAAGVLLLFLTPLQRWADRAAARTVPTGRSFDSMTPDERAAFYQQQYMFALSDGGISADERRMLDFARRRLGIPVLDAKRIEQNVAGNAA